MELLVFPSCFDSGPEETSAGRSFRIVIPCVLYIYIFIKIDNNIETFFICFEQLRFPIICWDFPNEESKVRFEWLLWLKWQVILSLLTWFWGCGNIKDWFEFQTNDGLLGQESDLVHFWNLYKLFLLCFVLLVCVDSVDSCYGKAAAVTAQIHSCETLPMALQSSFSSFIRLFVRTRYCTFSQIKVYVVAKRNHCDWFIWIVS